ncbi:hybrid sensor histidine kinase/response regulator [Janthinobacterium psychrotolerans]|uniref:histidine kinase n=1 Tax=Janthinobacterium psychrotolerans TaxID=1747903 RepID=A0A1A7BY56_9BURK|nr:ATP-binding protein [Janthinobacterium psychrotolerans]OBV38452.1 PAS domain S-box-containing protein [Janthinobacterium psychrotolerans]
MVKHDLKQNLPPPPAPLSLSDAGIATVLEGITDGFSVLDANWTIRYINARGAELLAPQHSNGSAALAGSNLWQACPDMLGTELETQYRRAMASQQSCSFELLHAPLGRWLEVRIFAGADGLTTHIHDISQRKAAEESLRQSEEDLRALADSIPQLAWIANFDGTMAWYNQRWHDYTGTSPEEMAGEGWDTAYDPQYLPQMLAGWKAALHNGTPFEMEFPIRGSDGRYRWFLTRANPVHRGGQLLRWFGTSTDVDEVKHVEEALRDETRVLELLNSTGTTLAGTLDLPSLLQETVDAATRISGARFGAFYYDAEHEADAAGYEPLLKVAQAVNGLTARQAAAIAPDLRTGQAMRHNDLQTAPDDGDGDQEDAPVLRSCLSLPVRSRSGQLLGRLLLGHPQPGMFSQRSERIVAAIAAQAAVALDNTRLYVEARRAAEERKVLLDSEREARAEAERTNQLKDEFLTTLSHELRTPLSAILGWAQVLRRGTRDQADLHRGLNSIERNARAQAQLIEDLLDMSRITSDKVLLDMQTIVPATVIASAIDTLRPALDAKHIILHTRIAANAGTMTGDPGRMQQVVWNLLSNALKFTPQGGQVDIDVVREGTRLVLTIADNGMGIRADFLPHVFDRFRQADASTTRKHGGLGLGLAIVKHLVEQHGGTVAASSPGEMQGATFTVRLPADSPALAPRREPAEPRDLAGIKVLVVDDEADARELAERILRDAHADVASAASAAEALRLLAGAPPDILVSDIGMPDTDGFELLAQLRERGGDLPALALTAFARPEDHQRALDSGFQAYLVKPLDPAALLAAVAGLVMPAAEKVEQKP